MDFRTLAKSMAEPQRGEDWEDLVVSLEPLAQEVRLDWYGPVEVSALEAMGSLWIIQCKADLQRGHIVDLRARMR